MKLKKIVKKPIDRLLFNGALVLISILMLTMLVQAPYTSTDPVFMAGTQVKTANYIVWNEGATYYGVNGLTGALEVTSTNASYAINTVLASLTPGRTWQETVVLLGEYTITHTLEVEGYTKLVLDCNITLADNSDCTMLTNANHATGDWYIDVEGGTLNGNSAGQTTAGYGILFNNTQRWNIRDVRVLYCYADGIRLDGTAGLLNGVGNIESCYIFENMGDGIHLEVYSGDCKIQDNDVGGNAQEGIECESGAGANTICNNLVWNNGNSGTGYNGIYIYDADANTIEGNRVDFNGAWGINCFGDWNTIADNTVYCNSYRTGYYGSYDGIRLYNSTNSTVTGCLSFNSGGNYHAWGISEAGSSNWNLISDNLCFENAVGGITTVGANTTVSDCFNGTDWIGSPGTAGPAGPAGPAGTTEARQPYDYLVFRNATSTYMINGVTGAIDASGSPSSVINTAVSIGNDLEIWLSSNTFTLTGSTGISITNNGITLRGSGEGTSIECSGTFNDHIIHVEADYVTIKDLTIDGTNQASSYHGIVEDGSGNGGLQVHHVKIEDCGSDGIRLGDTDGSWEGNWGKLHHNVIRNNGQYGIYLTYDATDSEIMDFLISGHDGVNDAGIRIECAQIRISTGHLWGNTHELMIAESDTVRGLLVSNVGIMDGGSNQGQHRILHTSANPFYGSTFTGCEVWVINCQAENTYDGFSLTGVTWGIAIVGTVFRGDNQTGHNQGRYAIDLDASVHNMTITANIIHGFEQGDPIETTGANDITELGNIEYDNGVP